MTIRERMIERKYGRKSVRRKRKRQKSIVSNSIPNVSVPEGKAPVTPVRVSIRNGVSNYGLLVHRGSNIHEHYRLLKKYRLGITRVFGIHMRAAKQGPGGELPWKRVGNKLDISKDYMAYLKRLKEIIVKTKKNNIVTVISLLEECGFENENSSLPGDTRWSYNPFNASNNVNGINGGSNGVRFLHSNLGVILPYFNKVIEFLVQVQKVCGNLLIIETCNEPTGGRAWEEHVIRYVRAKGYRGDFLSTSVPTKYRAKHIHSTNTSGAYKNYILSNDGKNLSPEQGAQAAKTANRCGALYEYWNRQDNINLTTSEGVVKRFARSLR